MESIVSVIVPVYNTASYLEECIQSLICQTYKHLQIILIDDGSTDNSSELCDKLAQENGNIKVIHKENQGLGMARNSGLEVALGEFVCFLDSDDTLELDTVEECVKQLTHKHADACYYGRKTQGQDGVYRANLDIPTQLVFEGRQICQEYIKTYFGRLPSEVQNNYIQQSACCAMYRRNIIEENQLRFVSERQYLSEDTFFNLDFCEKSSRILIIPKNFYNYRYNAGSLTKKHNPNKLNQLNGFVELLEEYSARFTMLSSIEKRVYFTFYIYLRHIFETEMKMRSDIGNLTTLRRIREIYSNKNIMDRIKYIPTQLLDKKRKAIVFCMQHKLVLPLYFYYGFLK